ncbi:MAG: M48 family metalloprotease, partial [Myxococcales bacterium]
MSPRARPGSPLALLVVAALAVPALALAEATPDLLRYFTAEEIAEREAFSFPLRMNWLVSQLLNVAATVAFLGFGLNRRLRLASEGWAARLASKVPAEGPLARIGAALSRLWGDGTWSGALLFGFAYFAILQLMALPQSFYFDWVYQRAHGLSVEPFGRWLKDMVKGQLTGVLAFSFLVFGLYGLVRKLKRWPLVLGIPCAVLLLGAGILDPYRTRFYFDYVPMPKGEAEEKIRAVLAKAGVEYEGVYVLKMHDVSRRVNASLEGEGPTRRIVVWDTTLATLTPDEVANAVAHEVGHLNDRGIGKPVMAGLAVIPLLLGLSWFLRRLGRSGRFGFDGERDVAGLPAAMFFIWLLITV